MLPGKAWGSWSKTSASKAKQAYIRRHGGGVGPRSSPDDARDLHGQHAVDGGLRGEHGLGSISEDLYGRVTHYHAQIGSHVSHETLLRLETGMLREARELVDARKFEEALNCFTHALAISEKAHLGAATPSQGVIVHEIAECLHHLGEFEAAEAYYTQALETIRRVQTPKWEARAVWALGKLSGVKPPDVQQARVLFIKSRLLDVELGRLPEPVFLDENGIRRKLAPVHAGARRGAWEEEDDEAGAAAYWDEKPSWLAAAA